MSRRSPIKWPDGARIAVLPCVAFETWPDDIGKRDSMNRSHRAPYPANARFPKDLSVVSDRDYGERVGVFRMLDIFAEERITTTFFINGATAEARPEIIKEILAAGHEIATESYIHDYNYMKRPEEEHADLQKTIAAVKGVADKPPLGFLSQGIQPTDQTALSVADLGYVYWMDLQHEDLPYTLRVGKRDLVVMDYMFGLNDYNTNGDGRTARDLLEMWKDSFDQLYAEGATNPNMMTFGMHPFLTGRPYRAPILREFLRYAKGHKNVWFPRCIDVARWWLENYRDHQVETWPNVSIK
jgi:allantoinase